MCCLPPLFLLGWKVCAAATVADSEATRPLTVVAAMAEALQRNPELKSLQAHIDAARSDVNVARQYPSNPEIVFAYGIDYHIGLSQQVEWPGKRALREAIARHDVLAAQSALEGFRVDLASRVRAGFYDLLVDQKIAEVERRRLQAAETFVAAATKRVEQGFAPVMERTKARIDLVGARRDLRAAQTAVSVARASLNLLMGRATDSELDIQGDLAAPRLDVPIEKLIAAGRSHHPDVRAQRLELEKKGLSVRLARKDAMPEVTVEPFYEQNTRASSENRIGVGVTLPLPLWNTPRPKIASAIAEERDAEATLEKTERDVEAGIRKAHAAYEATVEDLSLFPPDLLKDLEEQLAVTEQKYAAGELSYLVLTETQRTFFDYVKSYFETIANVWSARSDLEKAAAAPLEEIQ
jgi:outer membrane protein, heavy metal efflux system